MSEKQTVGIDSALSGIGQNVTEKESGLFSKSPQESSNKGRVKKHSLRIKGEFDSGTFGSKLTPFGFMHYLPGTVIKKIDVDFYVRMQPLAHLNFSEMLLKMYAIYVPHIAIWENADVFLAAKSDPFKSSISGFPMVNAPVGTGFNTGFVNVQDGSGTNVTGITTLGTSLWRDTIAYHYYGNSNYNVSNPAGGAMVPGRFNALLHRGYIKIWNDIFRVKEVSPELPEIKDDGGSVREFNTIMRYNLDSNTTTISILEEGSFLASTHPSFLLSMPAENHYYNSFRRELYSNNNAVDLTSLFTHNKGQLMVDFYRSSAEQRELNEEEILAETYDTSVPAEQMVRIIGEASIPLSMTHNPSSAETGGLHLGTEGAFSITRGQLNVFGGRKNFVANRAGNVHFLYAIVSPTSTIFTDSNPFETTMEKIEDVYRPEFENLKDREMYLREVGHHGTLETWDAIIGYVPRFSELTRLPSVFRGDMNVLQVTQSTPIDDPTRTGTMAWIGFADPSAGATGRFYIPSTNGFRLHSNIASNGAIGGYANNIVNSSKYDQLNWEIRECLLFKGSLTNLMFGDNFAAFSRRMPFTFMLGGTYTCTLTLPVSPTVLKNIIPWGSTV